MPREAPVTIATLLVLSVIFFPYPPTMGLLARRWLRA
jgi:hypothetical protein